MVLSMMRAPKPAMMRAPKPDEEGFEMKIVALLDFIFKDIPSARTRVQKDYSIVVKFKGKTRLINPGDYILIGFGDLFSCDDKEEIKKILFMRDKEMLFVRD